MAFPATLTLVTVTCHVDLPPAGGLGGVPARLTFTRSMPLTGATDGAIVPAVPQTLVLDDNGDGTIQLPAQDAQWSPADWTYGVRLEVGTTNHLGTLELDGLSTEVEFADLIQWNGTATTGVTYATLAQLNTQAADNALTYLALAGGTITGNLAVQGVASLGGKNSLSYVPFAGRRAGAAGPPLTGTWAAGEVVSAADGLWQCVADGTPGTWLPLALAESAASPLDHQLAGWSFDPTEVQGGTALATAGLGRVIRVRALAPTVSAICFHLTAGGSGLTSGQCFAALYNDAGALLGAGAISADQATAWATGGYKECTLSVQQGVTPGAWYRVLFWYNGSTGPTVSRGVNSSSAILNAGISGVTALRYSQADTGLTTTAPNNLATQSGTATAWWVALKP